MSIFTIFTAGNNKPLLEDGSDRAIEVLDNLDREYWALQKRVTEMSKNGRYSELEEVRNKVRTSIVSAEGITLKYATDGIFDAAKETLDNYRSLEKRLKELGPEDKKANCDLTQAPHSQ